ncbi:MAG: hypothetical protein D6685_00565 [Bacteroidetes bacterium]|nr:hypothetical protein AWN76_013010 [Rhodothermaceae bacterium RA]RMH70012.1 MAG: hypothetical protein D6685_00565 [Bacteroidota bacterium]
MNKPLALIVLLAGLIMTGGCSMFSPDDAAGLLSDEAPVQVEIAYHPEGPSFILKATYTNRTGNPVYFTETTARTGPLMLEKQINGTWSLAYAPFTQLIMRPPQIIQPDSSLTMETPIYVPHLTDGVQGFVEEVPGTYRLVLGLYESWNQMRYDGRLLPKEARVSHAFEIEG